MNETIKTHLDAIAEELKGTPNSFLFLLSDKDDVHAVKNCPDHNAAALMFIYIDSTESIDTAFSTYVLNMAAEVENDKSAFKDRLSEKMDEKQSITIEVLENPDAIKEMWGDDLFDAFADHFDKDGWLTVNWGPIVENKYQDLDENYNENATKKNIYTRMYMQDFQESDCKQFIRPTE
ncbi:hypothetical protein [Chryseobacterium sp.]|uniref:hypothetical protein n=1 Tax=Chryseobacterium sp. TaxID=1871047 RepID=UPI000ECD7609|nr:hypothetical protein [Chryseobacterium sp.]HCM34152.1 hypothetical protein [Chryseobacterium sp.]